MRVSNFIFPGKRFIEPYSTDWKAEFEQLKEVLKTELTDYPVDIQHVGSTSVPGLHAKPILDIDIILEDKGGLEVVSKRLEKLGYNRRGEQGIPGRFAFRQQSPLTPSTDASREWMEHHLYVCFADSLALKNHLMFRDRLLADRGLLDEYSRLKIRLAGERGMTREKYTERKTEFILSVLATLGLNENELRQIHDANK